MGKRGPDELFVLVDGYDIGQDCHELTVETSSLIEQDTHGKGVAWTEASWVGINRGFVDYLGMYDDADNRTSEALDEHGGLDEAMCVIWGGNVQGRKAMGLKVLQSSHNRAVSRTELAKASAHYESSGAIEEGIVLSSLNAESADGETDDGSHDFGAAGTRSAAYLQVTELDLGGYDSVTVAIQESSDDGAGDAWVDVATFTTVTAESVGERIAIAATVERYVRAELTWVGSGSSESVTMSVVITD